MTIRCFTQSLLLGAALFIAAPSASRAGGVLDGSITLEVRPVRAMYRSGDTLTIIPRLRARSTQARLQNRTIQVERVLGRPGGAQVIGRVITTANGDGFCPWIVPASIDGDTLRIRARVLSPLGFTLGLQAVRTLRVGP